MGALGLAGDTAGMKFTDAYSGGAKLLFAVPKYAGLGAHWSLEDDEADDLGAAIQAFVKSLPKSQRAAWEKRLSKYFPGINLLVVASALTVPRVMATVQLAKMQQAERAAAAGFSPSPSANNGNGNAGTGPANYDLRDITERYQKGPAASGAAVPASGAGEAVHDDGAASDRNGDGNL